MNNMVIAAYDNYSDAQAARNDLLSSGIEAQDIEVLQGGEEADRFSRDKGFWETIRDFFTGNESDESYYTEASRRGATLLRVHAAEANSERVRDILDRHNPLNIDERAKQWQQRGLSTEKEQKIPVVEEQMNVGKQQRQTGGVRIYSRVTEQPVSEDVTLREEHIRVERTPTDRPAEAGAFEEKTIEAQEIREEPVISKEARVVEEVSLTKDVDERIERVQDTVRRTDVKTEDLREGRLAGAGSGYERDAYQFGESMARDDRYRNEDFEHAEPELRTQYEQSHPDSNWSLCRNSVKNGYDSCRRRAA